jgi:ubiquinone/menaquinone biosynthesis C-methylase UbiE
VASDRPLTGPSDSLRAAYEARAEDAYSAPGELPDRWRDRKFARIWEQVEAHLPCDAFLDAGCGDGVYLRAIARSDRIPPRVAGLDISERILATARASAAPLEVELVRGNIEALPFEEDSFDLVLCSQAIEHLLDPELGVRELARVLAPAGTLILTTDNARNLVTRTFYLGRFSEEMAEFPHRSFRLEEVEQLVRAAGLEIEERTTFRFALPAPFNLGRAARVVNRIEAALPPHGVGDIVIVVARKPSR